MVASAGDAVILCDHKHTGSWQSDSEKKCFGIALVIPDGQDTKCPLLLEYM